MPTACYSAGTVDACSGNRSDTPVSQVRIPSLILINR